MAKASSPSSSQQDFVLFALLGFIVFYILPKHLLHYYRGHGADGEN